MTDAPALPLPIPLDLTPRQAQVVRYLCHGLANKEIAVKLDISIGTVKSHAAHARERMGVKTTPELIYALRDEHRIGEAEE